MNAWIAADTLIRNIELHIQSVIENTGLEGLSGCHIYVLAELHDDNGQKPSNLARKIGRLETSFTPILDKLENMGFVERRQNPFDRRSVLIYLTSEGRETEETVEMVHASVEAGFVRQTEIA